MTTSYYIASNDWVNISFRLCFALLMGGMIGLERQRRDKPAGLRTHMLVTLGSAIFTIIAIQIGGKEINPDALSRVIQGIAAGVGFLGTGEILRSSSQQPKLAEIHGLTSAAAIWVSASLGIASGCGLWQLGLIGTVLTVVVLNLVKKVEKSH
ncbi:MgtC/SapB family protein [Anabaena cylindrica FACHB-243]|uniref:MgtC/SapB family protein n=1 Tax=Anabaena sp. PCC 7938 TaxID=1296340 RepID=UPI001237740B|nr:MULTISPECIES: MgtC/SapB family protein [Anabaena]MBD2416921.1 MgtC/SapB family protein [Anabaena cylindrica FACHB-243]MBY5281793.1 MgtC/SapB family protein [Anabaena sp. CCAP 1446/1C]MBY5310117.1 MgtC/SapB family protein [Anabaena sp. CCAP 1446/1C]MCM2406453.1 MgtC/SapB family protein [Anabaena sp. CCAP 1446/1C]